MPMFNTLEEALLWTPPPTSLLSPRADSNDTRTAALTLQTFKLRLCTTIKTGTRILTFSEEVTLSLNIDDRLSYTDFRASIDDTLPRIIWKAEKDNRVRLREIRRDLGIYFGRNGFKYLQHHDEEAIWSRHLRPLLVAQQDTWCIIDEAHYVNDGEDAEWMHRLALAMKLPSKPKLRYQEDLPSFWQVHSLDEFSAQRPPVKGEEALPKSSERTALFEAVKTVVGGAYRLEDRGNCRDAAFRKKPRPRIVNPAVTDQCSEAGEDWIIV